MNAIRIYEPETWEDLVSAGIAARESKDAAQWALGDIACRVPGSLADFAKAVNIQRSSISEYKSMA